MTDTKYYNEDRSYELMAAAIDSDLSPYDETAKEDITYVLKLCYLYTTFKHAGAQELADAIVNYFAGGFGVPDFHAWANEYMGHTPEEPVPGNAYVNEQARGSKTVAPPAGAIAD